MAHAHVYLYDSLEQHHFDERTKVPIPVVRIFPQILKYVGFYDQRTDLQPLFKPWKFSYPENTNPYKQLDNHRCDPISLKYVEFLMTHNKETPLTKKDIEKYRAHIARTIYEFNTDEDTI